MTHPALRTGENGAEPAVATVRTGVPTCALPSCDKPLTGRQTKYCSPHHKIMDYERLHPRLDFESYLAPRPLPEEPEARRDALKAVAASNNKYQRAIARWAALMCFGEPRDPFTEPRRSIASDVRTWCDARGIELEWAKQWTGSLFQCPWFEAIGTWRNAGHRKGNARKCVEWCLTPAGRAAYLEARERMR